LLAVKTKKKDLLPKPKLGKKSQIPVEDRDRHRPSRRTDGAKAGCPVDRPSTVR
jgi:hypothetical protein